MARTMEIFAVLMLMGVRVREVCNLDEESVWLPSLRLLLIDAAMSAEERGLTCCRILGQLQA